MKILFLDIDGVINSDKTCEAFGGFPHNFSEEHMKRFDHVALALIRKACKDTGTSIVLSSAWREYFTAQQVAEALDLPVNDCTPIFGNRGMEINKWLTEHPEVTTYAIVDDNNWMLPEQQEFFVQTNPWDGLSFNNYRQIVDILTYGEVNVYCIGTR